MSVEAGGAQYPETTAIDNTQSSWFARLFGFAKQDPTIPNAVSNGTDVPVPGYGTIDKYGLDFGTAWNGTGTSDTTRNAAPAADQSWFTSIWTGAKSVTKFVFCPIFTTCPAPLPPEGITIGSLTSEAGTATGNAVKNALSPILPILLVLVVGLVLINMILSRLTTPGR